MSELISGEEAKLAWANGKKLQIANMIVGEDFYDIDDRNTTLNIFDLDFYQFRLKPRTITINGIEVPAPFEPKEGDKFFYLNDGEEVGYIVCTHDWGFDPSGLNFGAWRTEEEVQQVIAALRQVFGGSHDN